MTLDLINIVADKVRALCTKNPAYETILREVLKADQICENPGFQFKDLQTVSGGHINSLLQTGLIIKSYESNNYTHYRLAVPREELESILDDIEIAWLESEKKQLEDTRLVAQSLLTPELVKEFEELVKNESDLLSYWALRLNPRIIGMERERAACLISMASPADLGGIMRRCNTLIWGPPGCQPAGSKVLMNDGQWKEIQNIQKEDTVLSPQRDNTVVPVKVVDTFEYINYDTYRICVKGRGNTNSYICSFNHILPIIELKRPKKQRRISVLNEISVKDYLKKGQHAKNGARIFSTPAYDLSQKQFVIHPYILGCMIGNGSFTLNGNPTFCHGKIEIFNKMQEFGSQFGKMVFRGGAWHANAVKEFAINLQSTNLQGTTSHGRFVPKEYMISSLEQRLWLLAGLIDTDGTFEAFTTVSKQLAEDFKNLIFSIGGWAVIKSEIARCLGNPFPYYRIHYSTGEHTIPVQLDHKKRKPRDMKWKNPRNHNFTVEYLGKDTVYGFQLESGSQWYVTDDWLVTHNTAKSVLINYIKHYFRAVGISPKATTEVGLTVDARGQGTDGALVMAHGGVLTIEEIEKFPKPVLETLFEAMSTGEFDVNKGDIHEKRRAEIRAIAVGNDIKKLPEALIDRFDMIYFYEIPDKSTEKKITDDLYQQWLTGRDDYKGERLKAYLEWIKPYEPTITQDIMNKITKLKNAYIDLSEKKADIREKEAFLKVSYTIAKINHRALTVQDFLKAISLVDSQFNGSKYLALETIAKGM
jgi:DNA replicative helicase MCM subunit Mcm2 (Cdc46/Mcm family)